MISTLIFLKVVSFFCDTTNQLPSLNCNQNKIYDIKRSYNTCRVKQI